MSGPRLIPSRVPSCILWHGSDDVQGVGGGSINQYRQSNLPRELRFQLQLYHPLESFVLAVPLRWCWGHVDDVSPTYCSSPPTTCLVVSGKLNALTADFDKCLSSGSVRLLHNTNVDGVAAVLSPRNTFRGGRGKLDTVAADR